MLLFQTTHGDMFSLNTWHKFLETRDNSVENVSFDEMRIWLCAKPEPSDTSEEALEEEKERLESEKLKRHEATLEEHSKKEVRYIY